MRKNINRTTVIIVLAIFLTISVGYALFSDTITIEGTATAKGEFDIEASCITNVSTDMLYDFGLEDDTKEGTTVAEMWREHGYKDVSCLVDGNTVKYSAGFDYPRAQKNYVIKMKNVGQIPAYYEFDSDKSIFNEEYYGKNIIKKYDSNDNLIETITSTDLPDWGDAIFIGYAGALMAEDTDGNLFNLNDEGIMKFQINGSQLKLEPGESVYFLMASRWADHPSLQENNIKYVATSTLEFNWNQVVE